MHAPNLIQKTVADRLLKKKVVAERLAVSKRTLDRMVAAGKIEKVFVGASSRFRESDIDRIVSEGL
jgi:excisionase family DNA binding protein